MNKEKIERLTVYLNKMKSRLTDPIPVKHKRHPDTYLNFLNREIKVVVAQLEEARLEGIQK